MNESINTEEISSGSRCRRWEPHFHAQSTIFNKQPKGANRYLTALEKTSPEIESIAVTDYYRTGTYRCVVEEKRTRRLRARLER